MAQDPEDDGPARTVFEPARPVAPTPGEEPAADADAVGEAEDAWFSGEADESDDAPSDSPETGVKKRRVRKPATPPSTILQPSTPPTPAPTPVSAAPPPSPPVSAIPTFTAPTLSQAGRVSIGSVLNHIYEVRRFIARGGMGEVYEGINVNSDEPVAIKVILPHLAADPNVQAMFRKEARTLTRLSHPALVQYRVLAIEPTLGVLYIVTEFVDGVGLDQLIGQLKPSQADLLSLTRRLAEGLRVAHQLGAIHRDISPDNILMPGGRMDTATIIDFGIAKDLDSSHATIVGDGFAGKLAFVAPEQFGDFGREIGPWTDVYSLGLVMLAVAGGKNADMGSTLVEAVDRRRAGPDLSVLPDALKPMFGRMLAPDPKVRLRSMDEVLQEIAAVEAGAPLRLAAKTAPPKPVKEPKPPKVAPVKAKPGDPQPRSNMPLIIAGAVGVAILAIGIPLVMKMTGGDGDGGAAASSAPASLEQNLQAISCSWLEPDGSPDSTRLKGAAQSGFEGPTSRRIKGADTSGVMFLDGQSCTLLDAVRPLKAPSNTGAEWVKAVTASFTPARHAECGDDPRQALAFIDVDTATASGEDMALYLLRPGGTVEAVFRGKSQIRAGSGVIANVSTSGPNRTRIGLCNDLQGPYGLLALRGEGPFTLESGGSAPVADRLAGDAKTRGWTSQMDWYRIEVAPASAAAPPAPAPVVVTAPVAPPKRKPVVARPATRRDTSQADAAPPPPRTSRVRPPPEPRPAPVKQSGSKCNEALGCP